MPGSGTPRAGGSEPLPRVGRSRGARPRGAGRRGRAAGRAPSSDGAPVGLLLALPPILLLVGLAFVLRGDPAPAPPPPSRGRAAPAAEPTQPPPPANPVSAAAPSDDAAERPSEPTEEAEASTAEPPPREPQRRGPAAAVGAPADEEAWAKREQELLERERAWMDELGDELNDADDAGEAEAAGADEQDGE